jgi:large subunit ribosomal protein L9
MKVILRENVPNVGKIGDILTVADGFGRNFLLPRKLATLANERNVKQMDHQKRVAASRLAKAKAAARVTADRMSGLRITAMRHAGEEGKLFGSVTLRDIADLLAESGYAVDKRDIGAPDQIKQVGEYPIVVKLHGDVTAKVTLDVKAAE